MLRTLDSLSTRALATRNTAVLRCGLGALGLLYHLVHYADRHFLFGPDAVWSREAFNESLAQSTTFSIYALADGAIGFEILFHLGILAALACTFGIGGRVSVLLHYVGIWSLYQRNPALLDGGDNLGYLLLPMLLLTRCTDHLSVMTRRSRTDWTVGIISHNLGVMLIVAQILTLYFMSGLYKAGGALWVNGTALYYVLRAPEFQSSPLNPVVFTSATAVTIGTYAAMLLLISMPLLILNPRTREPAVACAIVFHLSIAVLMGLWGFALTMIVSDVALLPEKRVEAGLAALRNVFSSGEPANEAPPFDPSSAVLEGEEVSA